MKKHTALRPIQILSNFLIPFVFAFAFYLQINGEMSPGGGFQSGIVLLMGFIVRDLVLLVSSEVKDFEFVIKETVAKIVSVLGFGLYCVTGFVSFFFGYLMFDYSYFAPNNFQLANKIGLFSIELGVAMGVFGAMCLIYKSFRDFVINEGKKSN